MCEPRKSPQESVEFRRLMLDLWVAQNNAPHPIYRRWLAESLAAFEAARLSVGG